MGSHTTPPHHACIQTNVMSSAQSTGRMSRDNSYSPRYRAILNKDGFLQDGQVAYSFSFFFPFSPPYLFLASHISACSIFTLGILPKTKWMVWFGVKTLRRFLVGGQKSGIDCDSSLHGCLRIPHRKSIRGAIIRDQCEVDKKKKKYSERVLFHMQLRNRTLADGNICVVLHICSKIFDVM
ncbi:hypothetical protein F4804DRAFT_124031 [Jackrogersella minutella]|nr:hypothetical protein F4804DRAFT_124031 [Jackrogersella minutella]